MVLSFQNAPLVESVAELHWGPFSSPQPPGSPASPQVMGVMSHPSQFFMKMGGEVYQHGFRQAERLVPEGFPSLPFHPVYRYRKDGSDHEPVFFQVGEGMFSANALPPYQSWEVFEPSVRIGVQALLNARSDHEKDKPFNRLALRYVNLFGPDLTGARDIGTFISEVMGFTLQLPPVLQQKIVAGQFVKPHMQLNIPLPDLILTMTIGEVMTPAGLRILMDNLVSAKDIAPDIQTILSRFREARAVIHDVFIGLTAPIQHLMLPQGSDS